MARLPVPEMTPPIGLGAGAGFDERAIVCHGSVVKTGGKHTWIREDQSAAGDGDARSDAVYVGG